jgi:hypothetical protein
MHENDLCSLRSIPVRDRVDWLRKVSLLKDSHSTSRLFFFDKEEKEFYFKATY